MTTTIVSSGVTSSGLVIPHGNALDILSGGMVSSSTIRGVETISAGGVSLFDDIKGASTLLLADQVVDGQASDTRVGAFGRQFVGSGGSTVGAVVESAAEAEVGFGGVASGGFVKFGGNIVVDGSLVHQLVESGGTVTLAGSNSAKIASGIDTIDMGRMSLGQFSELSDTIVKSGGEVSALSGGVVDDTTLRSATIVSSGGVTFIYGNSLDVFSTGFASGVKVSSGSVEQAVGGEIIGSYVYAGGVALIGGGDLNDVTISSGGTLRWDVASGEVVSGLTLRAGAEINVNLTSVTATISGDEMVLRSKAGTVLSATLATEAGLGFTYDYASAGQTEIIVTRAAAPTHPAALAQSMATFGGADAVTTASAHSAGLISAVAEMLKPR